MDTAKLKLKILDLAIKGKLSTQRKEDEAAEVLLSKINDDKKRLANDGLIRLPKNESTIFKDKNGSFYERLGNQTRCIDDEIPFKIPESWTFSRVGSYVKLVTDYVASGSFESLNKNVHYYDEPNYAVLVRTCDFKNNFEGPLVYTDKHGYDFLSNSNLFGGEIILSNIGASIGKVFIVPKLNCKMTLAPNSIMVKLNFDELNDYFYYLFASPYGQEILQSISASSAQAKFNKTDFKELLIPIPPYEEQIRIANFLKEIDSRLANIEKDYIEVLSYVNKTKEKVLSFIFSDAGPFNNYLDGTYRLGDILEYEQPGPYIVESTKYDNNYEIPVLTPGKSYILGYTNEKNGIYRVDGSKVIIFDDFTTASRLIDFDFKVKSSAMKILHIDDKEKFNIDYFYYLLNTIHINSDTHKRFWISEYATKTIRVHDIKDQVRIVDFIKRTFEMLDELV